jgi:hypothetical protein
MTQTRLPQTQTLYFRIVFVPGSWDVSKIHKPNLNLSIFFSKRLQLFLIFTQFINIHYICYLIFICVCVLVNIYTK